MNNKVGVIWEGPYLVNSSLGLVNRYLCIELMKDEGLLIKPLPVEKDSMLETWFSHSDTLKASYRIVIQNPNIHVRQQWPPNFQYFKAPCFVMFQPWEYGYIPKAWVEPIIKYVDEIWVNSDYTKQGYIKSGIPKEMIFVFPLGFDPEIYHPHGPKIVLKTQKKFKFLFVGGTIFRKGIDKLLSAYINTFTKDDDVCLVIKDHGDKTHYRGQTNGSEIQTAQNSPNAPEILYLNDDMSPHQLASLYRACDCLVHPYRGEGFGLPILEGMACGLPSIIPAMGSAIEFTTPDTSFRVVAKLETVSVSDMDTVGPLELISVDVDDLGKTMNMAFSNPAIVKKIGWMAASHANKSYSWKTVTSLVRQRILELSQRNNLKSKPQNTIQQVYRKIAHQFEGANEPRIQLYSPLAKCFSPGDKVIDLGSGDGIWLRILRQNGVDGIGVDLDPVKVDEMKYAGLNAIQADVVEYVRTLTSQLDGLSMLHIIEHMTPEQAINIIQSAARNFSYRGRILIVTPNFENTNVAQKNFWLDVTHIRPYPMELLNSILVAIGFRTIASGRMNGDMDTVVFGSMLANDNPFA